MTSAEHPMKVVLAWHMHQPDYRDRVTGEYQRPWVYLHAIKDYVDMAAHLEATPDARAVVNFSPILLEQLDDYAGQLRDALESGRPVRDPVLRALQSLPAKNDDEGRRALILACGRAHPKHQIERFPDYSRLLEIVSVVEPDSEAIAYLDDSLLVDLAVWYHLAWVGETVRRQDLRIKQLTEKGRAFDERDRHTLLEVIAELVNGVIARYRRLAESGQVELSISPYAHPMLPLLVDWTSAREAMPEVALPAPQTYADGVARARWHLDEARVVFRRHFAAEPVGCWPSEGGLSNATVALLDEQGFRWTASGEGVLRNSLASLAPMGARTLEDLVHGPYRIGESSVRGFFRNDRLSDLIGFTFSNWHGDDAVAHLVHALETMAKSSTDSPHAVVPIILDGENAWAHYPDNGYHFLRGLYAQLADHPALDLSTFTGCLNDEMHCPHLPSLTAGSWVYGTFSTWLGHPDKNRAWQMLADAGTAFSRSRARADLSDAGLAQAGRQLAVCEASDWFWWPGPDNPEIAVRDFDRLYRLHLERLYRFLGEPAPAYLSVPFTHGGGNPEAGGVMRRGSGD